MMGSIPPLAQDPRRFGRRVLQFANARSAFRAMLQTGLPEGSRVLLPSYIGWSEREGSGVFDPVAELAVPYTFYRMDGELHVDLDDLRTQLNRTDVGLLVIIHYFGYPDPQYEAIVALGREYAVPIIEDEAHSMFTNVIGGITGRLGDASIFSLHKLLPVSHGGMLVLKHGVWSEDDLVASRPADPSWAVHYDLAGIAVRRVQNAAFLHDLISDLDERVVPLRPSAEGGIVPQTFPVQFYSVSRDAVYFAMRRRGIGVVSLYHTMIDAIDPKTFPESHQLAHSIMNFPVHQDLGEAEMEMVIDALRHTLDEVPPVQP